MWTGNNDGQTVCPATCLLSLLGVLCVSAVNIFVLISFSAGSLLQAEVTAFSRTFAALLLHRYRTDSAAFSGFHPVSGRDSLGPRTGSS